MAAKKPHKSKPYHLKQSERSAARNPSRVNWTRNPPPNPPAEKRPDEPEQERREPE